jgi:hypothetical protein
MVFFLASGHQIRYRFAWKILLMPMWKAENGQDKPLKKLGNVILALNLLAGINAITEAVVLEYSLTMMVHIPKGWETNWMVEEMAWC